MNLRPGTTMTLPELDNARFSVWSVADEGPASFFAVPVDSDSPYKYVVIRATMRTTSAWPEITILRTERKDTRP